jgi:amidase
MLPRHYQSATRLARDIRTGETTAVELLELFLRRVDALNPALNAVIQQDREGARARAAAADAALARGEVHGPLHGVPITVKESFDVRGLPTTWGIPALAGHRAEADALAVQRLVRAGAVPFGKTNVPLNLADFQSYNDIYGVTENPWRAGRTPGGSSGGSAAALAAGLTALELGSDIGGSIRNPAHFCGVFGHKPTWELLPARGHTINGALAMADISVIGPLARTAADLRLAMSLLAQPDEIEARGVRYRLPTLGEPTSQLRIAVWEDDALCPVSTAVRAKVRAVADALADAGATVDANARPPFSAAHSHALYGDLLQSALAGSIPDDAFATLRARVRGLAQDDASEAARIGRAQVMRRRDWARLNEARTQLRWGWHRFFQQHDFVLAPIMPVTAFAHDHGRFGARRLDVDGHALPYFDVLFWAGLAGVAWLPATMIPAGVADDGLPVGVQVIGPAYGDLRTIALAERLEAMGFAFTPPPALG